MTCEFEDNALATLLPLLTSGDNDRFRDALRLLLNTAMVLERQNHLQAAPYERTEERNGQANGFKDKHFQKRRAYAPNER
jgi:transposase-like protein